MGIYSTNKPNSEIENYIDNSFLESCLNEEMMELVSKTTSLMEGCTWSELSTMVAEVSESSLPDAIKVDLINVALENMKTASNDEIVEEGFILEFKGNDAKNQEFIEILKELDELCTFFVERIRRLSGCLDKFLTITKNVIDKPNTFKSKLEEAKAIQKEFVDWQTKAEKGINGQVTWHKFRSKVKTFNNKYSEITMEEKKKFSAKITKFKDEIDKYCLPWYNGKEVKEIISNLEKLDVIDEDYSATLRNIVAGCQKYLISETNYTFNDIQYALKALNIEKENSFLYKTINKILK